MKLRLCRDPCPGLAMAAFAFSTGEAKGCPKNVTCIVCVVSISPRRQRPGADGPRCTASALCDGGCAGAEARRIGPWVEANSRALPCRSSCMVRPSSGFVSLFVGLHCFFVVSFSTVLGVCVAFWHNRHILYIFLLNRKTAIAMHDLINPEDTTKCHGKSCRHHTF